MTLSRLAPLFVFALACGGSASKAQPVCPLAPSPTQSVAATPPDDGLDALSDEQLVRKLLDVTGAQAMAQQVATTMLDTFAKAPGMRSGFIERFKENLHPAELVELMVPLYLQHYDHKTLVAVLRFYATPAGRAVLATTPTLTREGMEVGQRWAAGLAKKTLKELPP